MCNTTLFVISPGKRWFQPVPTFLTLHVFYT